MIDLWLLPVETLCSSVDRDRVLGRASGGPRTGPAADRCRARKRNWDGVVECVAAGPDSSVVELAPEAVVVDRWRLPRSRSVAPASLGQPLPHARGSRDGIICARLGRLTTLLGRANLAASLRPFTGPDRWGSQVEVYPVPSREPAPGEVLPRVRGSHDVHLFQMP